MLNKQHHASGVRPATQARGHKDTSFFINQRGTEVKTDNHASKFARPTQGRHRKDTNLFANRQNGQKN